MMRQYELVERVRRYDPDVDEDALNRAYVFSMKAHGNQIRASGDPYFSHPVEVAGLLSEKRLDGASIMTALLHDTVEDTETTIEQISSSFGPEVGALVDGVTKLSMLELQSSRTKQAENFRKLVLAMSQDIRVLLVKLADRLHNMKTLHFIKREDKRRRIARETLEIYVPLSERIGIRDWKEELEDMAFRELNPDARESIVSRLDYLHAESGDLVDRVIRELTETLTSNGIKAEVSGREKTPYSIWRKMQRQNIGFEQLSDIIAFRVIVDSVENCYRALGYIHARYSVVPGRFKDYISLPKPNGYESLHTGVIGPENQRIEMQIRTEAMHSVAELGVAAHWSYKIDGDKKPSRDGRQYRWMRDMLDILSNASGPDDFLEHTKMEMFSDQVFAFTPKGDLHALPRASTPIDFAYAVHTDVGNRCVGAKINGRIKPLRTELVNGDQVEIITSNAQTPSPAWEAFVVTGKARSAIRRFIRSKQRDQYISLGREVVENAFRQGGFELTEKALKAVLPKYRLDSVEDLYAAVGEGRHTGREVLHSVYPSAKKKPDEAGALAGKSRNGEKSKSGKKHEIPVRGLIPGMAIHYAKCCHPVPGDRIVGIVTTGKGVTIHTIACKTLEDFSDMPERWLDVGWEVDDSAGHTFVGRIETVIVNEPGSLAVLTGVIGRAGGNISNLKFISRGDDFFEMLIDIEVSDVRMLNDIIAGLRATTAINSVERAFS